MPANTQKTNVGNQAEDSLLTPQERSVCEQIAAADDTLHRQRAQALLALAEGAAQAEAGKRAGLSLGQVKYCLNKFRRQRLGLFPDNLIAGVQPEPPVASPEPVSQPEAAAEARPAAEDVVEAQQAETRAAQPVKMAAEEPGAEDTAAEIQPERRTKKAKKAKKKKVKQAKVETESKKKDKKTKKAKKAKKKKVKQAKVETESKKKDKKAKKAKKAKAKKTKYAKVEKKLKKQDKAEKGDK